MFEFVSDASTLGAKTEPTLRRWPLVSKLTNDYW